MYLYHLAAVSCSPDAYRLSGVKMEYGDGQAGPCMGRCMVLVPGMVHDMVPGYVMWWVWGN